MYTEETIACSLIYAQTYRVIPSQQILPDNKASTVLGGPVLHHLIIYISIILRYHTSISMQHNRKTSHVRCQLLCILRIVFDTNICWINNS